MKPDILTAESSNTSRVRNILSKDGQSLSKPQREFFDNRMNHDFTDVRIHTDGEAAQSAAELNAQAYTINHHIVFNKNKYHPDTNEGKKLLAHELTHVVQQSGKSPSIQRVPGDKHDLTSATLSGDPKLERVFDNELEVGKPALGKHVKKLQEGLIELGIPLPKFGADEQFGDETASAVKDFQQKAGMSTKEWDGIVGRKTIGLMDMSLRNHIIVKDEDVATEDFVVKDPKVKDDSCKDKPHDEPCPDPNTTVDKAAEEAIKIIDKVESEQLPPKSTTTTDYPTIFTQLFRRGDTRDESFAVTEVKTNYGEIKRFLELIQRDKSHVRCGTACDPGCRAGSPAYHRKPSGKSIITFCPDFNAHDDRILIVLHECHHAAITGSRDLAYADTRLIDRLEHTKALLNAASFHLYAGLVNDPSSVTIGPKTKDSNTIADATQKENAAQSIAHLHQWFKLVPFDMTVISSGMEQARAKGFYTSDKVASYVNRNYVKWFQVTPAPNRPKELDVNKAKAIQERSTTMENAFKNVFTIVDSTGASSWERGPGKEIKLNKALLTLPVGSMVIALLQQLVHATPDISAESEPLYVGLINDVRNERNLDP